MAEQGQGLPGQRCSQGIETKIAVPQRVGDPRACAGVSRREYYLLHRLGGHAQCITTAIHVVAAADRAL